MLKLKMKKINLSHKNNPQQLPIKINRVRPIKVEKI